jgi:Glycosyltransferases involved in cell wall biogenesis
MTGESIATWRETGSDQIVHVTPLISVLMIVYNHAEYLSEAIEGIVRQKCGLPFELIIGEDGSSDGSLSIALEYQKTFPQLIRVLHGGPNLGMNRNSRRVRAAARGKFLAWCEGDDYWCDLGKLEEQARILLARPESWCCAYGLGQEPAAGGWLEGQLERYCASTRSFGAVTRDALGEFP